MLVCRNFGLWFVPYRDGVAVCPALVEVQGFGYITLGLLVTPCSDRVHSQSGAGERVGGVGAVCDVSHRDSPIEKGVDGLPPSWAGLPRKRSTLRLQKALLLQRPAATPAPLAGAPVEQVERIAVLDDAFLGRGEIVCPVWPSFELRERGFFGFGNDGIRV